MEAVRVRLRADVPIGVYLSGGIDSSVIAGLATHLSRDLGTKIGSIPSQDRVTCFCIQFDKASGFDESGVLSCYHHMHCRLGCPDIRRYCREDS